MLFAIVPAAYVLAPITPLECAPALFLVIAVISFIATTVRPRENSITMHLVMLPGPLIEAPISPLVDALPVYIVVLKVACVSRTICPSESAFALFPPIYVVTLEASPIRPDFPAIAMLFVFSPVAFILTAIYVLVLAEAMGFIIQPVAFIDVAICVNKPSFAVGSVVSPVALIPGAIRPDLHTPAIPDFSVLEPLSFVLSSVLKHDQGAFLSGHTIFSRRAIVKKTQAPQELVDFGVVVSFFIYFQDTLVKDFSQFLALD